MLYTSQTGPCCKLIPSPNPVHEEPSAVICRDGDTNGSRCNPSPNPNPNPVQKELSTVTYRDSDTKRMVHDVLVTYQTLWHIGYMTQRADPAMEVEAPAAAV